jgi:3-oxoacyl-[acyl-carrier-protein] synthase II
VVVTGLGAVTPLGVTAEASWSAVLAGANGIRRLHGPELEGAPIKVAGRVADGDWRRIEAALPETAEREGERRTVLAVWAADQALADAGGPATGPRAGVALGIGLGAVRLEDLRLPPELLTSDTVHRQSMLRSAAERPAALLATAHDLSGPMVSVTSACASATQAVGIGYRMIRRGEADVMLCGGADSMIDPLGLVGFALLGAASTSADPGSACRPFDSRRSGLVMGEGAGMVVLEAEEAARARGARVYAELAGYGSSLDGYQPTAPHPEGRGAASAMTAALADARCTPADIDAINAHGTGTRLNDIAETIAVKQVLGERAWHVPVSASKSMIGHLLAACGAPELIFTVLSVVHDRVHPTRNLSRPDRQCDLDYVPEGARDLTVRAAMSSSFGFGGQNACVIVRKAQW